MDEKTVSRFWSKVDRRGPDECWEWAASRHPFGHGYFWCLMPGDSRKRNHYAHRASWALHRGEIPSGMYVCHSCDNPPCVNPGHLFMGTCADNLADMRAKGRGSTPPRSRPPMAKLTEQDVIDIRARHATGKTCAELGREYGVTYGAIWRVVRRINWAHL